MHCIHTCGARWRTPTPFTLANAPPLLYNTTYTNHHLKQTTQVLLLDEITVDLDVLGRADLMRFLQEVSDGERRV